MRNVVCFELRKGDMLESEMPMPIGKYIKLIRNTALKISEEHNLRLAYIYFWEQIMGRLELYRRGSEIRYAIKLIVKHQPIDCETIGTNIKFYWEMNKN